MTYSAVKTSAETPTQTGGQMRARTPRLREATFDDHAQIVALARQYNLPEQRSYVEWRHLWEGNPAYIELQGRWPVGWVLEAEGRIVGHMGNLPCFYHLRNRRLLCASGYVYVVDAAYRGYSLLVLDTYLHQKNVVLVLSNTANAASTQVHLQLGGLPVPKGKWDESFLWITNYTELLSDWLRRRRVPASRLLSYPASMALVTKDVYSYLRLSRRARSGAEVAHCTEFDFRFDQFWNELLSRYPEKLLMMRDRATLTWHFDHFAQQGRLWIYTVSRGARLVAYAVFILSETNSNDPIKRMLLADFQSLEHDDAAYYSLLRAALRSAREAGIHLVATMGYSASGINTSTLAPYRLKLPNSVFVYNTDDLELKDVLSDPQVWCPSLYDPTASL